MGAHDTAHDTRPRRRLGLHRGRVGAVQAMLRLAANICGWFAVSIFLTLYNKLSVTAWGLDFPLTITCVHLLLRMPMAMVTMRYLGVRAARFSRRELLVSVFPVSVMIALDIGLSNMAFLFVSVTYYTIVKSSVPI